MATLQHFLQPTRSRREEAAEEVVAAVEEATFNATMALPRDANQFLLRLLVLSQLVLIL